MRPSAQREMLRDLLKYGGYWEASKAQHKRMERIIKGRKPPKD